MPMKQYEVALSFAGPQRDYVEQVARSLEASGISVFYDAFEGVSLWGKDAAESFNDVYTSASYVIMFISRDYAERAFPRHERRSALSRASKSDASTSCLSDSTTAMYQDYRAP